MNEKENQRGQMANTLFTILLFLVFVLCALFSVLIGGKVYENINGRAEDTYQKDVALSYIANKVRQGDEAARVTLEEMEGIPVLKLEQKIEESVYVTNIYYRDGRLWELFTDAESGLGVGDGNEILECSPVTMNMDGRFLHIKTEGEGGGSLWLSLRSGGSDDE
ncbi:DUF4860 domain-containing protein [Lacrimispora saccharolytica]|uniref:DUF4860 domain-containing protein n=1 Tax=Lacrimispora saccharolytica (strain ATCC 35040 / DSM 2544 / NRCC 2533 / WM1) TaxID=610130 RepID=D9R8F3_LACSW|nr:DUF4860 domain-containing protein [Lacrimispora saccharolytica]ADL03905.1 hypothetical protein Closa_1302 [[Clostridium] saccharolyticum WM1]QRV21784.1 DUF4860 domain-containing protein [Lacrimispora saccharolytica]